MQPYLFPYLGYFQLIKAVDKFVIYDDVNYIVGGWVNRNRILLNGQPHLFSLQISKKSQNKKINELSIVPESNNRIRILSMIQSAYKRAPMYDQIFPIIRNILLNPEGNMSSYISRSIAEICKYLEIYTQILLSSELEKDNKLKGEDKIMEISKVLGGDTYINAIGGQDLYLKNNFIKNNLELKFIQMDSVIYDQKTKVFIPNLSIMDVLMFNELKIVKKMLMMYSLI